MFAVALKAGYFYLYSYRDNGTWYIIIPHLQALLKIDSGTSRQRHNMQIFMTSVAGPEEVELLCLLSQIPVQVGLSPQAPLLVYSEALEDYQMM